MDRNIESYTNTYLKGDYNFETIMVEIRRKKVLETLQKYNAKNILEIGCGMDSIFNFYKNFNSFVVVEPSKTFANKAKLDSKNLDSKIEIFNDFLENCIHDLKAYHFDFIILSSLLHEVTHPIDFLKQVTLLLKDNSILHINVPNAKSFHLLWAYESGLIKNIGNLTPTAIALQQNTAFDLESLKETIAAAYGGGGNEYQNFR